MEIGIGDLDCESTLCIVKFDLDCRLGTEISIRGWGWVPRNLDRGMGGLSL